MLIYYLFDHTNGREPATPLQAGVDVAPAGLPDPSAAHNSCMSCHLIVNTPYCHLACSRPAQVRRQEGKQGDRQTGRQHGNQSTTSSPPQVKCHLSWKRDVHLRASQMGLARSGVAHPLIFGLSQLGDSPWPPGRDGSGSSDGSAVSGATPAFEATAVTLSSWASGRAGWEGK